MKKLISLSFNKYAPTIASFANILEKNNNINAVLYFSKKSRKIYLYTCSINFLTKSLNCLLNN